ncbi:MAG: bifunctional hydroxymethylpyrimidine kinase/phosphomethylpyrimidine kinase, partial [Candidatus Eremiobacteraeota bacterium]|nr:bifunctional hydroxymethylpyrimidine kinase/phosphomethylpyrimidine kinase [Candidatus Eremiobacteraeota bacterium]
AAGVGLDIRALAACGVRPVTVVAGVTAQDGRGLQASAPVEPSLIAAQLDALGEADVAAYRVGALLDAASVIVVAEYLQANASPVVYDPVLGPSRGGLFAGSATQAAIATHLVPLATLLTPNLSEAEALSGMARVRDRQAMERAGHKLVAAGARAVLVKGGHLDGGALDVYVDGDGSRTYAGSRLAGDVRGTGCLLACAIAAALAHGATMHDAIERGRAFVRERIAASIAFGEMRTAY